MTEGAKEKSPAGPRIGGKERPPRKGGGGVFQPDRDERTDRQNCGPKGGEQRRRYVNGGRKGRRNRPSADGSWKLEENRIKLKAVSARNGDKRMEDGEAEKLKQRELEE